MEARHNNFDLLRILAALQVAIIHAALHLKVSGWALDLLDCFPGVPIFFVISGYLVSQSYERSRLSQYALNRALRIYPALWGCLAFTVALALLNDLHPTALWVAAQASFVQVYNPDAMRYFGVGVLNGSLWTIPVELQFYALLPLLYFVRRFAWLWGFALLVHLALPHNRFIGVTVLPYLYLFLLGTALQQYPVRLKLPVCVALYVGVAIVLYRLGFTVGGNELNPLSATLLGLTTIAAAHATPIPVRHDVSYGLYLYHMPVVNLCVEWGITGYRGIAWALASSLLLAYLSWRVIERPALRLKSHLKRSVSREPPITGDRIEFDFYEGRRR